MKNLCLLTVVLFTYITLNANDDPIIVKIRQVDAKKIDIQLANLEKKRTGIFILNIKGGTWLSDYTWNETGYHKIIDMTEMPTGEYLIIVSKREYVFAKAFELTSKHLIFFDIEKKDTEYRTTAQLVNLNNKNIAQKSIIANVTAQNANSIKVQLANLQGKLVIMNLYHIGNSSAFEDKVSGEIGYNKDWNLTGMPYGSYYVHLQTLAEESIVVFFDFTADGIMLKSKQYLFMPNTNGVLATK